MRASDGIHFLWNGEGCVRVSPLDLQYQSKSLGATVDSPRWHHEYGELPRDEFLLLEDTLNRPRRCLFEIKGHGHYQVIARGEFREL